MAFASARVHAYADCRSSHLHVWGGLPKDLPSHVPQHPKSLLAHVLNILLHHGLSAPSWAPGVRRLQTMPEGGILGLGEPVGSISLQERQLPEQRREVAG